MTEYNGTAICQSCGGQILPTHAMIDKEKCPPCRRREHDRHVRRRMT
jgi:predicted RNA-binding Zn-ribbon protein involved in translation (DUF1610 family)